MVLLTMHLTSFQARTLQDLPGYLAETRYRSPIPAACPVQKVLATKDTFFGQLAKEDKMFERITLIQKVMSADSSRDGLQTFPLERELQDWDDGPDRVLFVDVAGGMFGGQQCDRLKERLPGMKGRVVLQDQRSVLERVGPTMNDVELVAQDLFEAQSIQGAKFYHLREVLHDWSAEECVAILQNLASAMSQQSRVLIDEQVLPDIGATWQDAGADVSMMMIGGAERSLDEWQQLVHKAGLEILWVHPYAQRPSRSVLVVGRK